MLNALEFPPVIVSTTCTCSTTRLWPTLIVEVVAMMEKEKQKKREKVRKRA